MARIMNACGLKDTIANCYYENTGRKSTHEKWEENIQYGRGLMVGLVGGLIAAGFDFKTALHRCYIHADKEKFNEDCLPECWLEDWASFKRKD